MLPEDVLAIVLRHALHMQVLQFGPDVYEDLPDLAPQLQLEYVSERVSTALTMVKHSYKLFVKMLYGSTIAVWALPTDNGFDVKNRVCLKTAHSTFKIARSDGVFLGDTRSLQEQGITAGTTLREIEAALRFRRPRERSMARYRFVGWSTVPGFVNSRWKAGPLQGSLARGT